MLDQDAAVELIGRRRRQILVHSAIYYRLNDNIIPDHLYDRWSKELAELQQQYPEAARLAPYADAYADFDGSTGYHLPTGDPAILSKAYQLLAYHRKERG